MVAGNTFYVPWPDFSEWNTVREQLFSSNVQDTIAAYHTILMWKLKYDSIPTYIESTYSLLQVMVKEYEMTKNEQSALMFNEMDLRLSYSTALIRFINHVSSASSYKGDTLYFAAISQNIPDWIINMRNEVSHGQELPSLDALHIAVELSLKWLLNNYWENSDHVEPKVTEESHFDIDSANFGDVDCDTQNFFKKFFDIWELCDKPAAGDNVVSQANREIMLLTEELLNLNCVYFNNFQKDTVKVIQHVVNAYSRLEETGVLECYNSCTVKAFKMMLLKFIKVTVKGDDQLKNSLVITLLQTSFLSEADVPNKKWPPILRLLQEVNAFSFLIEIIFQLAGKGHKVASKWLTALIPSLVHLKKEWAIFRVLKKKTNNYESKVTKSQIQANYQSKDPDLVIPLFIFKPPVITLDMVKNILLNPEQFSVESIEKCLELVKPPLMKLTVDMIRDLVSLHVSGSQQEEPEDSGSDKIFTVDDLEKMMEAEESLVIEEASSESGGWTKSSIGVNSWNKCPLGLLPFQTKVDCSLPETLTWERKTTTTRKRVSIPLLKHSVNMKKFKRI